MNRKRVSAYITGGLAILFIVGLIVRTLEIYNYSSRAFIRSGLFYDKICYLGSYEMFVCPYTTQPYETYLTILAILLIISTWVTLKKK
ncbi:MAG: hypothetical protein ABSF09_03495 [Candidatus Bathyarchaeia archaeon]